MHMESGSIQFQMNAEHMDFAPVENGSIYETGLQVPARCLTGCKSHDFHGILFSYHPQLAMSRDPVQYIKCATAPNQQHVLAAS